MRIAIAVLAILVTLSVRAATVDLAKVKSGDAVSGFKVTAVYLNDADAPMGARFVHQKTGFTVDLLQIESVPQAYTWVNSILVSEQGEPHTQEHLLLGKGTRGRAYSGALTMSLAAMNAFTQQWRTSYHFNTTAGTEVFFNLLDAQLDALLHPNYSDEEIRREVRNFGVTENPDHTLRLEEKGSVYNEMVSSTGTPFRALLRTGGQLLYGPGHPMSMNAGGEPSGIRTMKPEDIRSFHKANYYLANMGTIVALPKSVTLGDALARIDAIANKLEPEGKKRASHSLAELPKPKMAAAGTIAYNDYPSKNDQQPSPLALLYPPVRELTPTEQTLEDLFLNTVAGDATSNLYKLFVDSKTRKLDIGARGVFAQGDADAGNPVTVYFTDVNPSNFNDAKMREIRSIVTGELARIAGFPDGSPELKEFNARVASRLVQTRRELANFLNTPPGFGARNTGSSWMDHLLTLEKEPGFRKSVTLKPEIGSIQKMLDSDRNIWREYLAKWKITGTEPYAVAARPSPALLQREETERVARADAEAQRLATQYGVADLQEAIKRYRTEYDTAGAKIEEEAKSAKVVAFTNSPPMTLDDELRYETRSVSGVPLVASTFENMTSSTVTLALRATAVPREQLRYLSLLPELLTRAGVIENGKPVPYEEMSERLRKEILGVSAGFVTNPRTGRVELVMRGSGIGADETNRAVQWMALMLESPDWRPENLARLRDLVEQSFGNLRNTMQRPEEAWVQDPAAAYRMQRSAAFLAADSFLTRTHNAMRLKWQLREAPAADAATLSSFLTSLATNGQGKSRAELKTLLGGAPPDSLSAAGKALAADAVKDLDLALIDIPDNSLSSDWAYLCGAIRDDLAMPPATALQQLDSVRRQLLRASNARLVLVGSSAMQKAVTPRIATLVGKLAPAGSTAVAPAAGEEGAPIVDDRLRQRDPSAKSPLYVGLFSSTKPGGIVLTSVPVVHYADFANRDKQLDYLASRLYAGGGAHGIFLKTLAAGLAYSNGLRGSVTSGRAGYYAERTPELPQTVRFVVNELKTAPRNTTLADYAIAQVFGETRAGNTYESRAEGIAADLADNQPPEQVRAFRESILTLRKDANLGGTLFDRKDRVYAQFFPGYEAGTPIAPGSTYFAIGPDKQLDAWDAYLKQTVGPDAKPYRLYARDFWMP